MKRHIVWLVAVALAAAFLLGALGGCEHKHVYDEQWRYDDDLHWKEPICGDTAEIAEVAPHIFNGDVCSVCGYRRVAKLYIFDVVGDIHTEEQSKFLADDYENVLNYARGNAEKSLPHEIRLCWHYTPSLPLDTQTKEFRLSISSENGGEIRETIPVDLNENGIQEYPVKNAYIDTLYDVTIEAIGNKGEVLARAEKSFSTTSNGPRNLLVDGVTNVRDLGGYVTSLGTVKQGLLFRTARLNRSQVTEPVVEITDDGIRTMLDELKVKTEIDLRSSFVEAGGLTNSVLGESVNYVRIEMNASNMFEQKDKVKSVFDVLCNSENYPIFFHCHIGTDRTGFIAFLCETLLGADEKTLYVDYLFSNFGHIGSARFPYTMFMYINELTNSYQGDTLAEKAVSYLLECGVTHEQINDFRNIMLKK